jgi:hypothetical protein
MKVNRSGKTSGKVIYQASKFLMIKKKILFYLSISNYSVFK